MSCAYGGPFAGRNSVAVVVVILPGRNLFRFVRNILFIFTTLSFSHSTITSSSHVGRMQYITMTFNADIDKHYTRVRRPLQFNI